MRIGFDVSQTGENKAGCGYFADSLIRKLASIDSENSYVLYPTFGKYFWDIQHHTTFTSSLPNFQMGPISETQAEAYGFWSDKNAHFEEKIGDVDIVHANNFFCPTNLKKAKLVYTLYDLSFIDYPEYTTIENQIVCFDGVFNASLYADLIIAISHATREHFLTKFPYYPKERVVVIHPASRFEQRPINEHTTFSFQPNQFWLTVGTIEPRKNITRILNAYAAYKKLGGIIYPLVLAGKKGWLFDHLEDLLQELGIENEVYYLGYVNNVQLRWLYQNCFCLLYPSLFEGFGLPIVEAMGFGKPFIASRVSSMPEIAGVAGVLVDPEDEKELLEAMVTVANNQKYHGMLIERSVEQSKAFCWGSAARQVLSLYQEVLNWPNRSLSSPFEKGGLRGI